MESVDGNEGAPQNAAPTPSTRRFLHTLLGKSFTVSLATKIVAANVAVDIIKEFNAEAAQHVVPLKSNANYVEFKEIVENLSAGAKFLIECAVPAVRGSAPAPGSSTATLNSTASSSSSPAAATTVVPKGTGAKRSADGLGRGDEGAAVMDAAIPAAKLQKASSHALLATACVHACPTGAATCIRWASCAPSPSRSLPEDLTWTGTPPSERPNLSLYATVEPPLGFRGGSVRDGRCRGRRRGPHHPGRPSG